MRDQSSWSPRYNRVPDNHLRITFDTTQPVQAQRVLDFALVYLGELRRSGFYDLTLIHLGEGSTVLEVSTAQASANLAKTKAETAKIRAEIASIKADSRIKNLKAIGLAGGLFASGVGIFLSMVDEDNAASHLIQAIVKEGVATGCEIISGDQSCEITIPRRFSVESAKIRVTGGKARFLSPEDDDKDNPSQPTDFLNDRPFSDDFSKEFGSGSATEPKADGEAIDPETDNEANEETVGSLQIWLPQDSGPLSIVPMRIPKLRQNSMSWISGTVINGSTLNPSIRGPGEDIALSGLTSPLGIRDGTRVQVSSRKGVDGRIYPNRIDIVDSNSPTS